MQRRQVSLPRLAIAGFAWRWLLRKTKCPCTVHQCRQPGAGSEHTATALDTTDLGAWTKGHAINLAQASTQAGCLDRWPSGWPAGWVAVSECAKVKAKAKIMARARCREGREGRVWPAYPSASLPWISFRMPYFVLYLPQCMMYSPAASAASKAAAVTECSSGEHLSCERVTSRVQKKTSTALAPAAGMLALAASSSVSFPAPLGPQHRKSLPARRGSMIPHTQLFAHELTFALKPLQYNSWSLLHK